MSELIVQNLRKKYKARTVVHDISLNVQSGEVVGLLGPNGAGKTTSFYMIVGLVPSDAGHIILNEKGLLTPSHGKKTHFKPDQTPTTPAKAQKIKNDPTLAKSPQQVFRYFEEYKHSDPKKLKFGLKLITK